MRGTLGYFHPGFIADGIIPAYAGNTIVDAAIAPGVRDHPRICGEH